MTSESRQTQSAKPARPTGADGRAEREARQAEALRANLRKRKAQARGRDALQPVAGPEKAAGTDGENGPETEGETGQETADDSQGRALGPKDRAS